MPVHWCGGLLVGDPRTVRSCALPKVEHDFPLPVCTQIQQVLGERTPSLILEMSPDLLCIGSLSQIRGDHTVLYLTRGSRWVSSPDAIVRCPSQLL